MDNNIIYSDVLCKNRGRNSYITICDVHFRIFRAVIRMQPYGYTKINNHCNTKKKLFISIETYLY